MPEENNSYKHWHEIDVYRVYIKFGHSCFIIQRYKDDQVIQVFLTLIDLKILQGTSSWNYYIDSCQ